MTGWPQAYEPSDAAVREALYQIVGEAELAKRTVHGRMAFADRVMQIVADELSTRANA